ncbi:MAG: hypothetical protein ACFFBP_03425 [Promethearchaeota archaeon]
MPDNDNKGSLLGELKACEKCNNAFMAKPGETVCSNCIALEKRKKELSRGVNEWKEQLEGSIKQMKHQVDEIQSKKEMFLERIKTRSALVKESINLLKKIEETKDEKYIDEYKTLFERMKKENE